MADCATEEQVTIRIMVDENKNRVVCAQAGKDFVEALLSFLTLPLGTIARLVAKESNINEVSIGSISSLYESVANLEEKYFWTETCKEMLLQPRNSMEDYCRNLRLNIDDTENMKYFICEDWKCSRQQSGGLLSTFKNKRCKCKKLMNREISLQNEIKINHEGFVPDVATFIIFDDLKVLADDFLPSVLIGIEDFNAIKEITVNITQKEIVDLLECSLLSKTPFTELFLRKKQFYENAQSMSMLDFNVGEPEANVGSKIMKVKLMLRKSNTKILFAIAEQDFVDILFSFLTFPLGGVEQMLKGNSCLGSIDNLYKSMVDLDGDRYLSSPDLKNQLLKPPLAHQFKLQNQILPIDEVPPSNYSCYTADKYYTGLYKAYLTFAQAYSVYTDTTTYAPLSYLEPQSCSGETYSSDGGRGFARKPSQYMVTDDLVVTPISFMSAVSFLAKSRIPPHDLEESIISIGKEECLSILKASLISSSALTNGLAPFIKPIKKENISN